MWKFMVDCGKYSSEHFGFLLTGKILSLLHTHLLSGAGTVHTYETKGHRLTTF